MPTDGAGVGNKAYQDDEQSRDPGSDSMGNKHIQNDKVPIDDCISNIQYNDTKLHHQEIIPNIQGKIDAYSTPQKSMIYETTAL